MYVRNDVVAGLELTISLTLLMLTLMAMKWVTLKLTLLVAGGWGIVAGNKLQGGIFILAAE